MQQTTVVEKAHHAVKYNCLFFVLGAKRQLKTFSGYQ